MKPKNCDILFNKEAKKNNDKIDGLKQISEYLYKMMNVKLKPSKGELWFIVFKRSQNFTHHFKIMVFSGI